MPWTRVEFRPGVTKDRTRYGAFGTWYDGSLVRFRNGLPEAWGGWVRNFVDFEFSGICRSLHRHSDLSGFQWVSFGTNNHFYMVSDDLDFEVTPIEESVMLGADPLATVNGSDVVTVMHTAHGKVPGQTLIMSGATAVGGISAGALNTEHVIQTFVDDDNYTIVVSETANSTTTGGGAAINVDYLYIAGSENQIHGGGWGSLTWGEEEWGGDPAVASADSLGVWTQDNWGEDLVANIRGGPIFYWDATNPGDRMVDILDLVGADGNAPAFAEFIVVSHRDRHLLAFGAEEFGTGNNAPMSFRWCDQEDILNWDEADTTNTAGSLPLSKGSYFIAAIATNREIMAWTDQALYSIQYIGAPFIYGADLIESKSDILGLKAATVNNGVVYWMGRTGIYMYDGRVRRMDCTLWDYVIRRINFDQIEKVFTSTNRLFGEVIWFYPSTDGLEIDSYIALDTESGAWTVGSLIRTAWLDGDSLNNPIATALDGKVYLHEVGGSNGENDPPTAINSYIESAPFELSSEGSYDRGDRFMFVRRILPDVTFRDFSGVDTPSMNIVLKMMDKPGGGFEETSSSQVTRTATIPVEEFTDEVYVRLRGRAIVFRAETNTAGSLWRLGVPRIDMRTDGQR